LGVALKTTGSGFFPKPAAQQLRDWEDIRQGAARSPCGPPASAFLGQKSTPPDRHIANVIYGGLTHMMWRAERGTYRNRLRSMRFTKCLGFRTYDSSGLGRRAGAAGRFAPGRQTAKRNPLAV
jgi:hypothetical protein